MSADQLIVQLPIAEGTNFDTLIRIEETLIQAFEQNKCAVVDGHDIGQGRFNIFLLPVSSWASIIERVKAFLKLRGLLNEALIVKRLKTSGRYVVVWPEDHRGTFEL